MGEKCGDIKMRTLKELFNVFLYLNLMNLLTPNVSLGWLYHNSAKVKGKGEHEQRAIHCLTKSVELDTNNGQTWYMLGR